jgi:acyl-coenzyme A thioesterase PaaI-like protein
MKTNFLHGAREEDFVCRAKSANRDGKLLAHHTITYIRPT